MERQGWRITAVRPPEGDSCVTGSTVTASISCRIDDGEEGAEPCPIDLTESIANVDGCELTLQRFDDQPGSAVNARLGVSIALERREPHTMYAATQDPERPIHRDPDRLARLYTTHETFTAMADEIPDDVSPETIRRYAIEQGIHEPGDADRNGETASKPPVAGLPEAISIEEIIETVEHARTLYEVQRGLDLDRDDAVGLLRQLDLLDLVVGRIDRDSDHEHRREIIGRRLRQRRQPEVSLATGRNR